MPEEHPFSYQIVPRALHAGRYRWSVFKGTALCDNSPVLYATKQEAKSAAEAAMLRAIKKWQSER